MIRNYTVGLTGETVSVNPRCWKIFKRVPRLGVVLQDSIHDNYEKIVLTLDRFSLGNYDGIKVVNVIDWLLG